MDDMGTTNGYYWELIGGIMLAIAVVSIILYGVVHFKKNVDPLWKKIASAIMALAMIAIFFVNPVLFFVFTFGIGIASSLLTSNNRSRFLKFQETLPTSKIRSMAMGLVEVEGELGIIKPIFAPINNKACIGYRYTIENIKKDDDGKDSYHTIHNETKCERFFIEDETGKVEVKPDGLGFVWVPLDEQYKANRKRYSQYILKEKDKMLLVGKASLENDNPIIEKEEIRNVFAISPASMVTSWNESKPLRRSALMFASLGAILISTLLMAQISIENGRVFVRITSNIFTF